VNEDRVERSPDKRLEEPTVAPWLLEHLLAAKSIKFPERLSDLKTTTKIQPPRLAAP
jgi:hypothetical protein